MSEDRPWRWIPRKADSLLDFPPVNPVLLQISQRVSTHFLSRTSSLTELELDGKYHEDLMDSPAPVDDSDSNVDFDTQYEPPLVNALAPRNLNTDPEEDPIPGLTRVIKFRNKKENNENEIRPPTVPPRPTRSVYDQVLIMLHSLSPEDNARPAGETDEPEDLFDFDKVVDRFSFVGQLIKTSTNVLGEWWERVDSTTSTLINHLSRHIISPDPSPAAIAGFHDDAKPELDWLEDLIPSSASESNASERSSAEGSSDPESTLSEECLTTPPPLPAPMETEEIVPAPRRRIQSPPLSQASTSSLLDKRKTRRKNKVSFSRFELGILSQEDIHTPVLGQSVHFSLRNIAQIQSEVSSTDSTFDLDFDKSNINNTNDNNNPEPSTSGSTKEVTSQRQNQNDGSSEGSGYCSDNVPDN